MQSELLKQNKQTRKQPSRFLEREGALYDEEGGVSRGQMTAIKNFVKETLAWGEGQPQQLLRFLPDLGGVTE